MKIENDDQPQPKRNSAKRKGPPPLPPLKERIMELLRKTSKEERDELRKEGVAVPAYTEDGDTEAVWGYRCHHCPVVALEFIGTAFYDSASGAEIGRPTSSMRFADLPWRQPDLEVERWDRVAPICYRCERPLSTRNGRLRDDLIVDAKAWRASRDEAEKRLREKREKPPGTEVVTLQTGETVELREPRVQWMERWSAQDRADVDEYIEREGIADYIARQRGFGR